MDDVDRLFQCFKCGVSPPSTLSTSLCIDRYDRFMVGSPRQPMKHPLLVNYDPKKPSWKKSAIRERKRNKEKLKQAGSTHVASTYSDVQSPESAGERHQNANNVQPCMKELGPRTVEAERFNCHKHISPVIFYGSPHGVPPKRPSSLLRLLREIRVELSEQNKSDLREEVWATFPRQDESIKFAQGHADVHIFSYQDHLNGQRRFLVSTYKEFWQRYKNMDSKFRHHYEVIQEGFPCHLYFDLEFNKKDNAEKDGDEMVDLLISVVSEALLEKYSIQVNEKWIVELDSSTGEKFSRHLIIRIPKIAFKDNSHAGVFVAEICSQISSAGEGDGNFKKLFVSKGSTSAEFPCQLFVDTAVYSRNRCFRLALSSKAGKNSVLLPTGRFKCKDMCEEEMFMASLICNIDVDCEKFLVCKMDLNCVKTLHFDMEENHNCRKHSSSPQDFALSACTSNVSGTCFMGNSPFPAVDIFVESIASIGNVSGGIFAILGKIRSWYWFSEYRLMVYSMSRNRYCERIGRQHKSNHAWTIFKIRFNWGQSCAEPSRLSMCLPFLFSLCLIQNWLNNYRRFICSVIYVVDLRRAIFYQKCHDPDCRGYRSPSRPIPMDVIPNTAVLMDSVQTEHHVESTSNHLGYSLVENDQECVSLYNDKSITDSCKKDAWWLEAIRFADNVESVQHMRDLSDTMLICPNGTGKTLEIEDKNVAFRGVPLNVLQLNWSEENIDDEDDDWWMAAERTASQTEQTYFNHKS
ncbi:DNA-directed primase/polymerase protein [Vitis vinifera]|uniref:DNA-directed primase/polymerase protein n=1 Tax=Vitis vinifera TaxID=29760 RepID=A0A438IZ48_VITVI|nr:DNA-directed primase/polymerase protein [Vitis vinifera]